MCYYLDYTYYAYYLGLKYNFILIYLIALSNQFMNGPGVQEEDFLLGAERDTPILNAEAVVHAEYRLRLCWIILIIEFIYILLVIYNSYCNYTHYLFLQNRQALP